MAGEAVARAYLSPTLVLLAFDWPNGRDRDDFLGFAIERTPGSRGQARSWLPNRITFRGPAPQHRDAPSNRFPIQKFAWWDARIDDADRGRRFAYRIVPVAGTQRRLKLLDDQAAELKLTLPRPVVEGIGTYFNRAVVSSQAFVREFGRTPTGAKLDAALAWLANGLQDVVPGFLGGTDDVDGVIYHLTDTRWIIPALAERTGRTSLVYNDTKKDHATGEALADLEHLELKARTKARIMHDKFLVRERAGKPASLLAGSANFTTEGLTTQANVLHTFDSPRLARLYLERKRLLEDDPTLAATASHAGWSRRIAIGDGTTRARVFFSPEPKDSREALETIVRAVGKAKSSVLFCLFAPTDAPLRHAIFEAGDRGLMMFGLLNSIVKPKPGAPVNAQTTAQVELFDREHAKKDVVAHALFAQGSAPAGFWWEAADLPGAAGKWPVYIHHKFVVIDAETDSPTIYTGSANMSGNSLHYNDENMLEITGSTALAAVYLAEFMRLYEHYRARASWNRWHGGYGTFKLRTDASWATEAFTDGTPRHKTRVALSGSAAT